MDINYLNFRLNIFGSHSTRLQLFAEDIEKWLNMKLMDLYCEDRIINSSIGCKNEDQENPIYFVLRENNNISDNTYALYFILNTTKENINQNIYQIIEAKIREEARNNIYSKDNKEVLKLFIEKYGKRTKEEIADIFNEKENIINQPDNITPKVVEEKAILKPYENLKCGIIMPNSSENEMYLQGYERYNIDKIIEEMYTSATINGALGEVSKKGFCFYNYNILPFNNIKDNLLSDFNNYTPYFNFIYQTCDMNFIIFCIYETLFRKTDHFEYNFIRYLVPIIVNENKEETVLEALLEYFNNIFGRVSNEYQRRIDAFQKKYNR